MANPREPHIIGVTLDSTGVATTAIIVKNRTTGDLQNIKTDASKAAIFDCANFTSGYVDGDIIEIDVIWRCGKLKLSHGVITYGDAKL